MCYLPHSFFLITFFNWRVIALQNFAVFSQTSTWISHAAAAAKLLQSCLTLCDSIDGSPPGSTIPGILQARTLEWVAISFSNAWKRKVKVKSLSCPTLREPMDCSLPGSSVHGFSRQGYWSGVPLPSPGIHKSPPFWNSLLIPPL